HNLYLEVLAERGLIGLAAMAGVIVAAARLGSRLRATRDPEIRALASAVLACLVGVAFAALLELTLLRLWVVVMIFVLLAILQFLGQADAARATSGGKEQ